MPDPEQSAIDAILHTPTPSVFSDVFGQNGSLYGPNVESPYGIYSPLDTTFGAPTNLAPSIFQQSFGENPQ